MYLCINRLGSPFYDCLIHWDKVSSTLVIYTLCRRISLIKHDIFWCKLMQAISTIFSKSATSEDAGSVVKDARYEELKSSLSYWAIGLAEHDKSFLGVIDALEYAEQMMLAMDKCGMKSSYLQPVEVALYVRTLYRSLRHPAETIMTALLSGVSVDHSSVTYDLMVERFGVVVVNACAAMNMKSSDGAKAEGDYAAGLEENPVASIVRGAQRVYEIQASTFFPLKKQVEFTTASTNFYLPMISRSRRAHPDQEAAYENMKLVIASHVTILQAAQNVEPMPVKEPVVPRLLSSVNNWLQKWFGDTREQKRPTAALKAESDKVES